MNKIVSRLRLVAVILVLFLAGFFLWEVFRPVTTIDKLAAIIHLEDSRELSEELRQYLEDGNPKVRARAALAIGRIGDKQAGQLLMGMLEDSVWNVTSTAAFAIGLTGNKDLAMPLLDYANECPAAIAVTAVEAAGRLADSSMTEEIFQILTFLNHPSPNIREAAIMALFRAGARETTSQVLNSLENETDNIVKNAGLYMLSRFHVPEAFDFFVYYLGNPNPYLRKLAVRGLSRTKLTEADKYLNIALNDVNRYVVAQAISSISSGRKKASAENLRHKLKTEQDEKLIVALINALHQLADSTGVEIARKRSAERLSPNITAATVNYAVSILKDRAYNYVDSLSREDDQTIKSACAEALAEIDKKNVVPRLVVLFKDNNPSVRATAFTSLVEVNSDNINFYIDQALYDSDYVVNALAVDKIGKWKISKYLPALHTIMLRSPNINVDLRRSLIDAMQSFVVEEPRDSLAMEILRIGLVDPDYVVRRDAHEIQKKLPSSLQKTVTSLTAKTRISKAKIKRSLNKYETNPFATIVTSKGEIEIVLYFDKAPLTVLNFIDLAERGFYEDLSFHRVIPGFVVQGGDPRGDGWGGTDYYIRCEYSDEPYKRGTLGIATSGKDTGGSQFFFTLMPQPHLEGRYTVFGQVLYGMEVVDSIVEGDVIKNIHIYRKSR
ncbi:MAG: HEAT repeat domain-containing protein [candidate division Zixibacteria bacterium]|nr:HEAT repeat domain-containing protein [candidate division Zixibacteria bacterium]